MDLGRIQVPLVNIPKMNRIVFMGMFTYPFLVIIGIDPPPYKFVLQAHFSHLTNLSQHSSKSGRRFVVQGVVKKNALNIRFRTSTGLGFQLRERLSRFLIWEWIKRQVSACHRLTSCKTHQSTSHAATQMQIKCYINLWTMCDYVCDMLWSMSILSTILGRCTDVGLKAATPAQSARLPLMKWYTWHTALSVFVVPGRHVSASGLSYHSTGNKME